MSEPSLRDEPCTPVKGDGWGNGREGPIWGGPNQTVSPCKRDLESQVLGGDNGNQKGYGHDWNQSAPWGNANNASASGDVNEWSEHEPSQGFETKPGAAKKRWGNWGGNGGGWGQNNVDRKKATRRQGKSAGWGNNNGWMCNVTDGRAFEVNNNQAWANNCNNNAWVQNPDGAQRVEETESWCFGFDDQCGDYCEQHNPKKQKQCHIHSRYQSESTVRPVTQGKQPSQYNNKSPFQNHTHYCHHTYGHHQPQNQGSSKEKEQKELIDKLQIENANLVGLITEQRIRIAVLENDVKTSSRGKEDAVNASVITAQTLGAAFGKVKSCCRVIHEPSSWDSDDGLQNLKRKLEALQKENQFLRAKDRGSRYGADLRESASDEEPTPPPPITPRHRLARRRSIQNQFSSTLSAPIAKGKGKEKILLHPTILFGTELNSSTSDVLEKKLVRVEGMRKMYEKDKPVTPREMRLAERSAPTLQMSTASEPELRAKIVSGWDESFISSAPISTIPNTPVANPSSSNPDLQLADTFRISNEMIDVGMESLDDILGDEYPGGPKIMPGDALLSEIESDLEALEPQIAKAMENLKNFRAPRVLKTGTGLEKSFRGAEYDHTVPQFVLHRDGMSNYNRFVAVSTVDAYSALSVRKLWGSDEEREKYAEDHKKGTAKNGVKYPDVFRYGIQYVPEEDDENYIRTVSIRNLPSVITLREVLTRVRGGSITDAVLMDTRKIMGGAMSAMVKFVEDYDAQSFANYAAQHPIVFGEDGEERTAEITLIPTPTFPPSQGMKKRMALSRNTRCLAVLDVPESLSFSKLQHDLAFQIARRADCLLEIYLDENNTLHLEFSNMSIAGSSFGILTNWTAYYGLKVVYEPDPCAGLLEELALPVPPRPPMLPHSRSPSPPYVPFHNDSSSDELRVSFARVGNNILQQQVLQQQRKGLAALPNQKVSIPSFSSSNIKCSSWADEVIDESESSDRQPTSLLTHNPSCHPHPEHDEHDEPPHSHSDVLLNSPIEGVSSLDTNSKMGVDRIVEMTMAENLHHLMRESPSSFRRAPAGLAASRYATVVPGFEDRLPTPYTSRNKRSPLRSSRNASSPNEDSISELWNRREENRKSKEVEELPEFKVHPKLQPASLLAEMLDSGSDSKEGAKRRMSGRGQVSLQELQEHNHAPTPYPSPSPSQDQDTAKLGAGFAIKPPSWLGPDREFEPSPCPKFLHPEKQRSPLEDFNAEFDPKGSATYNSAYATITAALEDPSTLENPHTPTNTSTTPPSQTPQKLHKNAEVYNHTIPRSYYPVSAGVPEGEWTQEDIETLRNSSPATKERYARLIELGREVGEFGGRNNVLADLVPGLDWSGGAGKGEEKNRGSSPVVRLGSVDDPFTVGGDEGVEANGGEVGKKVNPDEIDLDMDYDKEENKPCTCLVEGTDGRHSPEFGGYMSIGG